MADQARAAPFLRWPGGKRRLAAEIVARFPATYRRYFEPFVGSGAVFFQAKPDQAVLSDINPELMNAYRVVRDRVEEVIAWLSEQRQSKTAYYAIRRLKPQYDVDRAGRFIYLNRTAFNGIWRVNRRGEYNVPYGYRPRKDLVDAEGLRNASEALARAEFRDIGFERVLKDAKAGDLVYADPPFSVAHENNGFRKYNEVLFSWEDQTRLAETLAELANKGVSVVVSNAHHQSVRKLYEGFSRAVLTRPCTVAGTIDARTEVKEFLFVSENGQAK